MKKLVFPFSSTAILLLVSASLFAQTASPKPLTFVRTTKFTVTSSSGTPLNRVVEGPEIDETFDIPGVSGNNSPARLPAAFVPRPPGNSIGAGSFKGFTGLDQFLQAIAPTGVAGGNNGQLEPPDQGLTVGNGFVLEQVNNAIGFYTTSGHFLGFEAMSAFFGVGPTFVVQNGAVVPPFGPFLSDPRSYYDSVNGHFIVTELEIDVDPSTGDLGSASHVLIAVSQSNNPLGAWNVFSLDVSNDGDARFGGCPTGCFGDQPLIGADANGFYVSTNAFGLPPSGFRGAQVYAISLATLEAGGGGNISAVHFGNLDTAPGMPARSVQPSTVPPGGSFETASGGTEYFVSALDPAHTVDNRVTVWAMSNTSSLSTTPSLTFNNAVVNTETYGFPPAAEQKRGATPYADFLASVGIKVHEELVAANDDRMQQVVFAAGSLWTAVPTKVQPGSQGPVRAGAAWFILSPSVSGTQVNASVLNQGYISIQSPKQNSVSFPAVGVNASGKGAVVFSVVGEDFFPSAGYALLDATNGAGPIVISDPGVAPDDGFSGYFPNGRVGRWGDYSAAVSDESGNIWMATEAINPPLAQFPPGVLVANWGTFIAPVAP
jgi:hypothetical protein